jgi:hypothetical protein
MLKANKKSSGQWTDKYDAHCLEHGLTPSAKLLWQWLVYQGENQELEPDLQEGFNKWVGKKRGKPYDPKTLKTAIKQLSDCAVINIPRKFSWKVYRIFLRPLEWLAPKKKSRNPAQISNLDPSNSTSAEKGDDYNNIIINSSLTESEQKELERRISIIKLCEEYGYKDYQTLISRAYSFKEIEAALKSISEEEYEELERQHSILHLCAEYGVYFNPKHKNTHELFLYTEEDVKCALEYFVKKGGHETHASGEPIIRHPNGYLIKCLREGWHEEKHYGLAAFLLSMCDFLPKRVPGDYE